MDKSAPANMLAAILPPAPKVAPVAAPKAAPSRAPVPVTTRQPAVAAPVARQPAPKNHGAGYSQAPMMGDKQKIQRPPVSKIASTVQQRPSADVTSGVSSSLAALADELHPVKKRR